MTFFIKLYLLKAYIKFFNFVFFWRRKWKWLKHVGFHVSTSKNIKYVTQKLRTPFYEKYAVQLLANEIFHN